MVLQLVLLVLPLMLFLAGLYLLLLVGLLPEYEVSSIRTAAWCLMPADSLISLTLSISAQYYPVYLLSWLVHVSV